MAGSVRALTAENATILVGLQWLSRVFAAVTKIVLARLLFPEDFGVFALAAGLVGFVSVFGNFGLDYALIQRGSSVREVDYDVAMSIRLLISLGLFGATVILAIPWSGFFGAPLVTPTTQVLALVYLVSPWSFIPSTRLSAKLNYRGLILPNVFGQLTNTSLSIGLAFAGFRVWALIIGTIASQIVWVISVTRAHPWSFRFRLERSAAGSLLGFSRHLVLVSILGFLVTNVDNFTVGYFLGTGALGFYIVAFSFSLVSTLFSGSMASALFPSLSTMKDDLPRLRRGYLEGFAYAVATIAHAALGLALLAPEVVIGLLGPLWTPSAVPLTILAFYGLAKGIGDFSSSLFAAIGRPRVISQVNGIVLLGSVVLLVPLTIMHGTSGAAVAMTIPVAVSLIFVFSWSAKALDIRVWELLSKLRGPIVAAEVMATVVFSIKVALGWILSASVTIPLAPWSVSEELVSLCVVVPAAAAVYAVVLRSVDRPLFAGLRAQLLLAIGRKHRDVRSPPRVQPRD